MKEPRPHAMMPRGYREAMVEPEVQIQVDDAFRGLLKEDWLASIAQETIAAEGITQPTEASLLITDQETVQRLNRNYRNQDEPTDVLAFSLTESHNDELPFPPSPDGILRLGEVIISHHQAVEQATEQGHAIEREMALLTIHGILHLLGYDHTQPEDEARMRTRETEILGRIYQNGWGIHRDGKLKEQERRS